MNLVQDLGLKEEQLTLEIDVIAEVEEYLTKRRYNTTSTLKMYDRDIKVELVKSAESFKPGLKYTAHVSCCIVVFGMLFKVSYLASSNLFLIFTIFIGYCNKSIFN